MAKNTRGGKQYSREQRLINENRNLKKELSHLRKQIARLDNGRMETIRQMVLENEEIKTFEKNINEISQDRESLKEIWACRECQTGFLEIVLYSKLGVTHYYRKCNSCENRTKGKRYGEQVKGIVKNG